MMSSDDYLKTGYIITTDNFGESLSCGTVRNIIPILRKMAKRMGVTFVLATQNPMVVDIKHLDKVRIIVRQHDGRSLISNIFFNASNEGHDTIEPILNALTISRNYMRTDNRRTVFAEGITDYYYLTSFCEVLHSKRRLYECRCDFIPINGVGGQGQYPEHWQR